MNIHPTAVARKLAVLSAVILACATSALAQDFHRFEFFGGYSRARVKSTIESLSFTTPDGGSGGYTDLCSAATGEMLGRNSQDLFCKGRGFGGVDLSATWNVSRYLGLKAGITAYSKSETFVDAFGPIVQTIDVDEDLYSLLAGIQLKDNGTTDRRWRPFAHALIGGARYKNRQSQDINAFPEFNFTAEDRETSVAVKIGGGLDVRLTPHIDLRVIEIDYAPVFAGDRSWDTISGPFRFRVEGKTSHNVTASFGIAVH